MTAPPVSRMPLDMQAALLQDLPHEADIVIDVPRFSHIKRRDDGRIDFVSPLPCPFNYGSILNTRSADGERIDAVVFGPRLARQTQVRCNVLGVVHFIDAGNADPKWICAHTALSRAEHAQLGAFFRFYAFAKTALNWVRGQTGVTRFEGIALR